LVGAILIVGAEITAGNHNSAEGAAVRPPSSQLKEGTPLACVEIMGRSVIERLVDETLRAKIDAISLSVDSQYASAIPAIEIGHAVDHIAFERVVDAWLAATQQLKSYGKGGVRTTLVIRAAAYVEFDPLDMLQFHREQQQSVTRAFDEAGPLDMWIIENDCVDDSEKGLSTLVTANCAVYQISGYVNRLQHPRDLRRLVVDSVTSRCRLRPNGQEIRPGVWIHEGAQIHRGARVVAPAFIGRGARIEDQSLITRCSTVEANCQVDYGTAIEDSSILANSYVGIGLDISHSIVNGNSLLNLERDVTLEITDPGVIRQNRLPRKEAIRQSASEAGVGGVVFASAE
jgi:NDP-sugar pyrophosphorylase family protein